MSSTFKSFQISFVICVMPELHGNIKTITGLYYRSKLIPTSL